MVMEEKIRQINILRSEINSMTVSMNSKTLHLNTLIREAFGEDAELGGWKCKKSPVSVCVYNIAEDPAKDECIFCGDPEERQ